VYDTRRYGFSGYEPLESVHAPARIDERHVHRLQQILLQPGVQGGLPTR